MNRKTNTLMSLGISVALIVGAIWFLYDQHRGFGYGGGGWYMPYQSMMGGYGGAYMGIFMILFWVVILAAIVMVVSWLLSDREVPGGPYNRRTPDALEILKSRYAKGVIDKAQSQAIKRELQEQ